MIAFINVELLIFKGMWNPIFIILLINFQNFMYKISIFRAFVYTISITRNFFKRWH